MNSTIKPLRSGMCFPFQCDGCGECCRHVKEQIMLEPLDAYRLGRFLKKESAVETVEEVYSKFAHPVMLTEGFPIFVLNTDGADDACTFLKNGRCSIYSARLRVCRLYPITVNPEIRGALPSYYQCLDQHRRHFHGKLISVDEWVEQNTDPETRNYMEREAAFVPELGRLLKNMSRAQQMEQLFHLLYYRYYNYELEPPFLEQYERNHRALLTELGRCEKEGAHVRTG